MEQQLWGQRLSGKMFQATVGVTQDQKCRGSSHCTNAAFPERKPGPCCWGRMGGGNLTSGKRVQIAWKHPSDFQRKDFSCSRKVFNNSGLLDTALTGLSFVLFSQHTQSQKNN